MARILSSMPLPPGLNETQFTTTLINTLQLAGWLVHHDRPARGKDGSWRTAIQGDKGFPDIFATCAERGLLVAELKVKAPLEPEQREWLNRFAAAGTPTYLWKPHHWLSTIVPVINGEAGMREGRWPIA